MIKQVQPESDDAANDDGAGYRYAYNSCGGLTRVQDPKGNVQEEERKSNNCQGLKQL